MKSIVILITCTFLIYACTRSPQLKLNRSEATYKKHISTIPATAEVDAKQRFELVFKDFKSGATEDNIRNLYAEKFYFNDTFVILNDIDSLVAHMMKTAGNVDVTTVNIHEVVAGKEDYYLKWTMHMKFKTMGRLVDSVSMGVSQVRFNNEGKIIFHQDYWDGSENLYEHLPLIGRFVKKIKANL